MTHDAQHAVGVRRASGMAGRVPSAPAFCAERRAPAPLEHRQSRGLRGLRLTLHATDRRHHRPVLVSQLPAAPHHGRHRREWTRPPQGRRFCSLRTSWPPSLRARADIDSTCRSLDRTEGSMRHGNSVRAERATEHEALRVPIGELYARVGTRARLRSAMDQAPSRVDRAPQPRSSGKARHELPASMDGCR